MTHRESLQNGLQALVMSIPQVEIIDQVDDGSRALEMVREHHPDLVLLDTNLPNDDVQQQRQAITLGADIVLLKGFPPARLVEIIEAIVATENTSP